MFETNRILTDAQLKAEIARCEYCEEKPCKTGCPADCSPADFIRAVSVGEPSDFRRSAALILSKNPLGGVCGLTCPDKHCQSKCVHKGFDGPIEIPSIQATIIAKAKQMGVMPSMDPPKPNGKRIAIVGGGPAGLSACAYLARMGYEVTVFEKETELGGACLLIPPHRLPRSCLTSDIEWIMRLGNIHLRLGELVADPMPLLSEGFVGVIWACGLWEQTKINIPGEENAISALDFLRNPSRYKIKDKKVGIIGGGAIAVDCVSTAVERCGAVSIEMFVLERFDEMPLTEKERRELARYPVIINNRTRVTRIEAGDRLTLETRRVDLPKGMSFHPSHMVDVGGTDASHPDIDLVIMATGAKKGFVIPEHPLIIPAGDFDLGPTTVVNAVASGKNAAKILCARLHGEEAPKIEDRKRSIFIIQGYKTLPVPLDVDFFGKRIASPFILSAAPPTDGYEQMRKGFEAGWPGGIMKTAFDGVQIHIPSEYMHVFDHSTYGNCDNVSGHPLDRVCKEVERLVKEYPDRLVGASTGGPVTGNDEHDCLGWQRNTKKLENAGAMTIEYSLSCPQGGDGTEGAIVSQNAQLTAKIIDWVMQVSDPNIPKLFKLTAAVTSITAIVNAVKKVFDKYPHKKAGITLANTFPTLMFRKGDKERWEEGIIVGMSGSGVAPISNLTLASVGGLGVVVSGNGGAMDYKSASHFLALGARTVQFCTVVMKNGYGVIDDLHSGLSHLLWERGIRSVEELIGIALPNPIRDFMSLPAKKRVSSVDPDACLSCGNCTRCSYFAIVLDKEKHPIIDATKCIGCSLCVQKCFAQALHMRERTPEEIFIQE